MSISTQRTLTYTLPDGEGVTAIDADNNGTIDYIRETKADAQGNLTTTEFYLNNDADAQAAFKKVQQDFGLNIKDFGQNEKFTLSAGAQGVLKSITSALTEATSGDTSAIQGRWADFVSQLQVNGTEDVNALVQQVLRESYLESTQDLNFYAQKVQFYNDLKKKIRDDLSSFRQLLGAHAGDDDSTTITLGDQGQKDDNGKAYVTSDQLYDWSSTPIVAQDASLGSRRLNGFDSDGVPLPPSIGSGDPPTCTKEQLSNHISDLEEQLNSVGDDAQLANVDLQNMLQKQQQTLQMMSNISKMLYDTAMAVVRKISA